MISSGAAGALFQSREVVKNAVLDRPWGATGAAVCAHAQVLDDASALHDPTEAMADDFVGFDAADFLTLEHDAAASDFAILALEQAGDRV